MKVLTDSGVSRLCSLIVSKISSALVEAKTYTDNSIAALVDSAPETLNTLGELAAALQENSDVVEVLDAAITTRVKTINGTGVDANGNIEIRELPAVSITDNNKFLVVVNGAWAATTIPSAEGVGF